MRIAVKVKPGSKEDSVEKVNGAEFMVRVKAPAREGRANEAALEVLAGYFGVARSRVRIVRGLSGRNKVIDII
ncbi:MAG: DUF167 domain-containing protein [Candidatus Omnitrophota bacterium]